MNDQDDDLAWVLIHQSRQARAELEDAIQRSRQSILQARTLLHALPDQLQQVHIEHFRNNPTEIPPAKNVAR
ncbi:hypothetical protein U8607_19585 [Methylobacterium durans]|uniref:hypothetical protein n=1 Tax=Methylobacterium durans TaxID=2202825 RepID=UPI002AFE93E1|nr:hypothetical protein [Methylobacterium durans]MEA1834300.1 hypothetical protein [Methylobacterium durans]